MSKVIDIFGAVDTVASNPGGPLNNLNVGTQLGAIGAGWLSQTSPYRTPSAITAGGIAFSTELPILIKDLQDPHPSGATIISDISTLAGDALIMTGAIVNLFPGGKVVSKPIEAAGTALTVAGISADLAALAQPKIVNGVSAGISETFKIIGDVANFVTTLQNQLSGGNVSAEVVRSTTSALSAAMKDLVDATNTAGNTPQSAASLIADFSNLGTSLTTLVKSSGVSSPDVNTTITDNSVSVSATSDPSSSARVTLTSNGMLQVVSVANDGSADVHTYDPSQGGGLVSEAAVNADGSSTIQFYDPVSHAWLGSRVIDKTGKLIQADDVSNITQRQFTNNTINTIADQIFADFVIKHNLPLSLLVQAFSNVSVDYLHPANPGAPQDFGAAFGATLSSMVASTFGSTEGAALFKAIGLPAQLGALIGGTLSSVATQQITAYIASDIIGLSPAVVLNNIGPSILTGMSAKDFADVLGGSLLKSGEALLGSTLEQLLFTNRVGPGSQIGGTLGALVGSEVFELIGTEIFPGLGTIVGAFLGSLLGGLFGGHPSVGPNSDSVNAWMSSAAKFQVVGTGQDNGGSIQIVKALGNALGGAMDSILAATGGHIVGTPQQMSLMMLQNKYYYAFGNHYPDFYPNGFNDPKAAVEHAAIAWASTLTIAGGDAYIIFTLKNSPATSLADYSYDLTVARAYSAYASDRLGFDVALAASNDPTEFAAWQKMLARAKALGLDKLTAAELQNLHQYGYVTPDNLVDHGTVIGARSGFIDSDVHSYFVKDAGGISVWQFDRSGLLSEVVQLHNINGSAFSLASGAKIVGNASNLTGSGEFDLVAQDTSGRLTLYKVTAQGVVDRGLALTYADGAALSFNPQPIPAYGSAAYTQLWQTTLRQLGYTGPFDGVTPMSWFQNKYHETLHNLSAVGMQQLLDHLHSVPLAPNAGQVLDLGKNQLGTGGIDLVSQDGKGHIFVHEVNTQGQAVKEVTLTYPGPTPFAYQPVIPAFNSDAYGTMWQSSLRAIGFTGPFDGKAPMQGFDQKYGVALDNTSTKGMQQLLDKVAALSPKLLDVLHTYDAGGAYTVVLQDHAGHLAVNNFNALGTLVSQQSVKNLDGSDLTLQDGDELVVSASRLTLDATNASQLVVGNYDTISVANGQHASLLGSDDTVALGTNSSISVFWGSNDIINGNGDTITASSNVGITVNGAGDTIIAAAGDIVAIQGNGQHGTTDTVLMSNGTVNLAANAAATIVGANNTINGGSADAAHINGNNNSLNLGTAGLASIDGGSGNIVHASGADLTLASSTLNTSIIGNNDVIHANIGASFNISGSGDTIIGSGTTIYLNSDATNVVIQGDNDTIHVRPGATYRATGSHETVVTDKVTTVHNGDSIQHYNGLSDLLDLPLAFDSTITATPVLNASHTAGRIVIADHGVNVATIYLPSAQNIGSFTVRSDGHGGTLIVDPPVDDQVSDTESSAAPPSTVSVSNDRFIFKDGPFHDTAAAAPSIDSTPFMLTAYDQFDFGHLATLPSNADPVIPHDAHLGELLRQAVTGTAGEITPPDVDAHNGSTLPDYLAFNAAHWHFDL